MIVVGGVGAELQMSPDVLRYDSTNDSWEVLSTGELGPAGEGEEGGGGKIGERGREGCGEGGGVEGEGNIEEIGTGGCGGGRGRGSERGKHKG